MSPAYQLWSAARTNISSRRPDGLVVAVAAFACRTEQLDHAVRAYHVPMPTTAAEADAEDIDR